MDHEPDMGDPASSIGALISLLADESRSTQRAALKALTDLGEAGENALGEAANQENPKLRARARQALQQMARRKGRQALEALLALEVPGPPAAGPAGLLIEGLLAIDDILGLREPELGTTAGPRHCFAETKLNAWSQALGEADAWREGPTLAASGALRRVLSDRADLHGPERDFHNLQHVSLTRTIISQTGLPLTLSAIYATVARRNGIEAWLLPFPGQVLLAIGPAADRVLMDPFHGGALVSLETCHARLAAMGAPPSRNWLEPASDQAMLVRQTRNLGAAMLRHGRHREARLFAQLVGDVD